MNRLITNTIILITISMVLNFSQKLVASAFTLPSTQVFSNLNNIIHNNQEAHKSSLLTLNKISIQSSVIKRHSLKLSTNAALVAFAPTSIASPISTMMSLIPKSNPFYVLSSIFVLSTFGIVLEKKTTLGKALSVSFI